MIDNGVLKLVITSKFVGESIAVIKALEYVKFNQVATKEKLLKIFSKVKNKSSSGPDNIPTNIIKEFCNELLAPLTHLIKFSFECRTFPECLKVAKVIPVHKKDSKESSRQLQTDFPNVSNIKNLLNTVC